MFQGRVKTSAPSYKNNEPQPLTMNPDGNLLVKAGTQVKASIIGKTAQTTVGGASGTVELLGVYIHTALTGTCVITGFEDTDLVDTDYVLPAGTVGSIPFYGAINTAAGNLRFTVSSAADDNKVIVFWQLRGMS